MKKLSMNKMGLIVLVSTILMGANGLLLSNYSNYVYTDIAHVSVNTMTFSLLIVNILGVINAIILGIVLQKFNSKWGKFRPIIFIAAIGSMSGQLIMFSDLGSNEFVKAIIISCGYFISYAFLDYLSVATTGLLTCIGGSDSEARDTLQGRYWQGMNLSIIGGSAILVPFTTFLGRGNFNKGMMGTQVVMFVVVMIGIFIILKISKPYDVHSSNTSDSSEVIIKIKLTDMLKGLFCNRLAIIQVVSDVLRYTGYYTYTGLMVYVCNYVLKDMNVMSWTLSIANFAAFLGALLAPTVAKKIGGRKKVVWFAAAFIGLSYFSIGIFGKFSIGFIITSFIAFFFEAFNDTFVSNMYLDAGEYWLQKTGHDVRTYLLSFYSIAVKTSIALSSVIIGLILSSINYSENMKLSEMQSNQLLWGTALVPTIGFAIPAILFIFHRISDKKMSGIIEENAEKYSFE